MFCKIIIIIKNINIFLGKPTKKFLGLCKNNAAQKYIPKLIKDNGEVIKVQEDIEKEISSFYEKGG